MNEKIVELESLRGLAAFSVVLTHIPPWNADYYANIFVRNTGEMVEFFFVLSGFVIALTYGGRILSLTDAARFQFLRFGRLYPVHLLFLLVVAGFEVLKLLFIRDAVSPPFEPGFTGPREFVENLLLIQGLGFSVRPSSFNGPSWTISTEFYVYALFALVVLSVSARKNLAFAMLSVGAAILLILDMPVLLPFSRFILCICGFFCGCLVAEISQRMKANGIVLPAFLAPLSVAALVGYLMVSVHRTLWESVVTFLFSAFIVLAVASGEEGRFKRALRCAPLAWLGMVSYSLYMAHYSVIHGFDVALRRFANIPTVSIDGQPVAQLSAPVFAAVCLLLFLVVLLVSAASYYIVERPARLWSRRFVAAENTAS